RRQQAGHQRPQAQQPARTARRAGCCACWRWCPACCRRASGGCGRCSIASIARCTTTWPAATSSSTRGERGGMASRLSDRLVNAGRVSADTMRAALARQAVYGGALDTALLETDAIEEPLLWEEMGVATGLPIPEPALCENPVKCVNPDGSAIELDGPWSERARAVPVGVREGALQILCGEPLVRVELDAASE